MRFRSTMSPTVRRWAGFALLGLVAAMALSACDDPANSHSPSMLDTHGPIAQTEQNLFWVILVLATFIFVVVTGALLYSIMRFRSRPNSPPARQIHGNTPLEIGWTIIPSVVLFGILGVTIATLFSLAQPTDKPVIDVNAVGHQWWWEFQYPGANGGQTVYTADELHVPTGTTVRVHLMSNNVIHGFWVPQIAGKMDVIPGRENVMWLTANEAGKQYRGECTEYCSLQHAHMDFVLMTQTPSDFQAWLEGQKTNAMTAATGSAESRGAQVFLHNGCVSCHNISGVTNTGSAADQPLPYKIGPNLTHFGGRALIAGGVLENTPDNLRTWILHAQQVKEGSDMPSFDGTPGSQGKISDQDIGDLVAYLESLK